MDPFQLDPCLYVHFAWCPIELKGETFECLFDTSTGKFPLNDLADIVRIVQGKKLKEFPMKVTVTPLNIIKKLRTPRLFIVFCEKRSMDLYAAQKEKCKCELTFKDEFLEYVVELQDRKPAPWEKGPSYITGSPIGKEGAKPEQKVKASVRSLPIVDQELDGKKTAAKQEQRSITSGKRAYVSFEGFMEPFIQFEWNSIAKISTGYKKVLPTSIMNCPLCRIEEFINVMMAKSSEKFPLEITVASRTSSVMKWLCLPISCLIYENGSSPDFQTMMHAQPKAMVVDRAEFIVWLSEIHARAPSNKPNLSLLNYSLANSINYEGPTLINPQVNNTYKEQKSRSASVVADESDGGKMAAKQEQKGITSGQLDYVSFAGDNSNKAVVQESTLFDNNVAVSEQDLRKLFRIPQNAYIHEECLQFLKENYCFHEKGNKTFNARAVIIQAKASGLSFAALTKMWCCNVLDDGENVPTKLSDEDLTLIRELGPARLIVFYEQLKIHPGVKFESVSEEKKLDIRCMALASRNWNLQTLKFVCSNCCKI